MINLKVGPFKTGSSLGVYCAGSPIRFLIPRLYPESPMSTSCLQHTSDKELSVKVIRSQVVRGFCSVDILLSGHLDADVRNFGAKRLKIFLRFMVCPQRQGERGGLVSADVFLTGGRGKIFFDFVRTSFMDSPRRLFLRFKK